MEARRSPRAHIKMAWPYLSKLVRIDLARQGFANSMIAAGHGRAWRGRSSNWSTDRATLKRRCLTDFPLRAGQG